MTVERTIQGYRVSTIKFNRLVSMHYIGYTRKEAVEEFREFLKELKN